MSIVVIVDEFVAAPRIMRDSEMDAGAWSCGMVVGLINDVPAIAERVNRIMKETEAIIAGRLMGLMGRPVGAAEAA